MKTPAQSVTDAKSRLQKEVVAKLRKHPLIWFMVVWVELQQKNKRLWEEMESYQFTTPSNRSRFKKVAFPAYNHAEVNAALGDGNTLIDIYEIARGLKTLAKDATGNYVRGRKGRLKVIRA